MIKIMFKILFSSLLFLSVITQSFAEEVKIIKINGNNRVSDQTIILFSEIPCFDSKFSYDPYE